MEKQVKKGDKQRPRSDSQTPPITVEQKGPGMLWHQLVLIMTPLEESDWLFSTKDIQTLYTGSRASRLGTKINIIQYKGHLDDLR